MRLRSVTFTLLGVLIIGTIAAPLVNTECQLCGGNGKLECAACGVELNFLLVDCFCGGDLDCPFCFGEGYSFHWMTKPCSWCEAKGWTPCFACGGDGKRSLLERIPYFWQTRAGVRK